MRVFTMVLIVSAACSTAFGQTAVQDLRFGRNGVYDALVFVKRDSSGNMVFTDKVAGSSVPLTAFPLTVGDGSTSYVWITSMRFAGSGVSIGEDYTSAVVVTITGAGTGAFVIVGNDAKLSDGVTDDVYASTPGTDLGRQGAWGNVYTTGTAWFLAVKTTDTVTANLFSGAIADWPTTKLLLVSHLDASASKTAGWFLSPTQSTSLTLAVVDGDNLSDLTDDLGLILAGDTFSGDVTATLEADGDTALTIADNSVDGTDISIASEAEGDVMYYNGTDWVRLAIGTPGQVLEVNAGGTAPEWDTDDTGGGSGVCNWTEILHGTPEIIQPSTNTATVSFGDFAATVTAAGEAEFSSVTVANVTDGTSLHKTDSMVYIYRNGSSVRALQIGDNTVAARSYMDSQGNATFTGSMDANTMKSTYYVSTPYIQPYTAASDLSFDLRNDSYNFIFRDSSDNKITTLTAIGELRHRGWSPRLVSVAAATSIAATSQIVSYIVTDNVVIELPDPSTCYNGRTFRIKATHASGCTVACHNDDADIDGALYTHALTQYEACDFSTDMVNWYRMGDYD